MDTVFFIASKLFWAVFSPDSLIIILTLGAFLLLLVGAVKPARRLLSICALLLLSLAVFPVGEWLIYPLETRFSDNTVLPGRVDGIIVLGGALDPVMSEAWRQPEIGLAAERFTALLYLAQRYPQAQIIYTGGSGRIRQQQYREADYTQILFEKLSPGTAPILYESESRNTAENASNSKQLVDPEPNQFWVLVTSAYHMPRAVGVFCRLGWPMQAYPVDHYARRDDLLRLNFDFILNLRVLRIAMHEWTGLVAYRLTGRTDRLLAGSRNQCRI
ncbi:MAG: YdcF family protein [Gammaproteobacteria bacterium]|nr:YdcF family protein [Gammaproteobacteria bacterium]MCY4356094.1 YdcF family protein [Gammaproteobacteria bacterium]